MPSTKQILYLLIGYYLYYYGSIVLFSNKEFMTVPYLDTILNINNDNGCFIINKLFDLA